MIVDNYPKMKFVRKNFIPIKNKLLNKNSDAENHFVKLLTDANIYFFREKCNFKYNTRWCYYDFYIPYYRLYVEIDGSSHDSEEQKKIDKEKKKIILNKFKFLARFTNEEILAMDSISIDVILERLYQNMRTRRHPNRDYKKRYEKNLKENYDKSIADMKKTAIFDIDENRKVYLYDNVIGIYVEFANIMEAKLHTQLSINEIYKLLDNFEYKRSSNRRYVFGWTLDECENNVFKVYIEKHSIIDDGYYFND